MFPPEQPPIPGYEPVRFLGMNLGAIYLARESSSGSLVTLKVFPRELAARFRVLYAPLSRLAHPNILRVFGMGDFEPYWYCALEYVEHSLADRLLGGPLPEADVARLTDAIASALLYARDQGMILWTLTPNRVLLTEDGIPKLMDFCPVGDVGRSSFVPCPSPFMAPEELELQGSTPPATDVYRVGAVMYAMLTGVPPFREQAGTFVAVIEQVVGQQSRPPREVNPRVDRDLEAICAKCLEKEPEARYASVDQLAVTVARFVKAR